MARTNGWPAPCTLVRWCRAAADAADVFADFFAEYLLDASLRVDGVRDERVLVMHSSTGIFEARAAPTGSRRAR